MAKEFEYRSYRKWELGMLYSPDLTPDAARKRLMNWIALQPDLVETLHRYGLRDSSKTFTPIQVRLIVEALGEP
jgi:hypothetical protein